MKTKFYLFTLSFIIHSMVFGQKINTFPEYSKAGFYELANNGREIFNFNVGWRFYKGSMQDAEKKDFDDSNWQLVNAPHGLELLSTQASGSNNYQGEAWYRKKFTVPSAVENKRLIVYFEGVMGKSKVWLNGKLLTTHFGGFLPFAIDISGKIKKGEENVLAVLADNSDDPSYPPGKEQVQLDYSYFGGIYRDVWFLATNEVYVTDPNQVDKVAGGGNFVHYENLSEKQADVVVATDIANELTSNQNVTVHYAIKNKEGKVVASTKKSLGILAQSSQKLVVTLPVQKPVLWSPQSPYLYDLEINIVGKSKKKLDGVREKLGIRKIEFRGKDGLYLNNKPYEGKLIGANRHQDFAYVGNALPNSGQWKDAAILKDAGCDIIREAHYPADPAFMDACDQLGLFIIQTTPGWQFWNAKDTSFEQGVYHDIRNMVRRDRNRPSIILWEPILNETNYPDYFAEKVHKLVHEENPFQGVYTACDLHAKGQQYFDVIYSHPYKGAFYNNLLPNTLENRKSVLFDYTKENRSVFTREWGDCVDDWNSHNSPSRAARNWGEYPQLIQAKHYAQPDFVYTSWESLYSAPAQHVGGTLWHSFDHQRGYHPDPFYGGIADVFRQPKYSFYMFKSQRSVKESNPMIYIANEMTPFSPADVTVYSNCDEVRLIVYEKDTLTVVPNRKLQHMPSPVAVFKNVFHFEDIKGMIRNGKKDKVALVAEGVIDGKVVVSTKKMPAFRASKIQLELYNQGIPLIANGSDFVTIIASIVDENGTVKRLDNDAIKFEITGEGKIIGDESILANPIKVEWGTAPVLIQSTTIPGSITVRASILNEGAHTPIAGEITFESVLEKTPLLFNENPKSYTKLYGPESAQNRTDSNEEKVLKRKIQELEKEVNNMKLKEVERQQEQFEGKKN